jgi:hypothetical protein
MKHKIGPLTIATISVAIMIMVAGLGASVGASVRSATLPAQVIARLSKPELVAEGFMRKLQDAKLDQIAAEIEKHPELVDDPSYLAAHPKLADYIQKHPEARKKIKEDPKGFFKHLKEQQG